MAKFELIEGICYERLFRAWRIDETGKKVYPVNGAKVLTWLQRVDSCNCGS